MRLVDKILLANSFFITLTLTMGVNEKISEFAVPVDAPTLPSDGTDFGSSREITIGKSSDRAYGKLFCKRSSLMCANKTN